VKHKKLSLVVLLMIALVLAACSTKTETTPATPSEPATDTSKDTSKDTEQKPEELKPAKIIITNAKGEIAKQIEQAGKDFAAANPNITVEVYSQAVGDSLSAFDRLTTAGNVVTVAMFEPGALSGAQKGFGIDLSGEKWAAETTQIIKDGDGVSVGFPFAIEGFGIVYNKTVVDKANGGPLDPYSINTRDKLKELFDKVKASGVEFPVAYQTEAWSVGNHFGSLWVAQGDPAQTVADVQAGTIQLKDNAAFNGVLDTMELLASPEYNKFGKAPLGKYYDEAHLLVGSGKSAFLTNGNWAFDSLKATAGTEFGFMPFPVDNDANNPMNSKIVAGPTQVLAINKKATPEEQAAAKKFLEWIVYDNAGQDFLVTKSQIIPAFKNISLEVTNPLGKAVQQAVKDGKTLPFTTNYIVPGEYFEKIGPEVQKFLDKKITREQLAKVYQDYHASKK
jgi:raffinose/stachyose/melibiose transport system substrate-binding protein